MRRKVRKLLHRAKLNQKSLTNTTKMIYLVRINKDLNLADLRLREIGPTQRAPISLEVVIMKATETESKASRWRATRLIKKVETR